jgi:hypothetical protein
MRPGGLCSLGCIALVVHPFLHGISETAGSGAACSAREALRARVPARRRAARPRICPRSGERHR